MTSQLGFLPKWPLLVGDTGSMIGGHAAVILWDLWSKGLLPDDVDREALYVAMRASAVNGSAPHARSGADEYAAYGYVSSATTGMSCTKTLEFAWDDAVHGAWAAKLGHVADAAMFERWSQNYRNVWATDAPGRHEPMRGGFFCARTSAAEGGAMDCPPIWTDTFDTRYTEGDAWHYRFFVPNDPEGLVGLFGTPEHFAEELDVFMDRRCRACARACTCLWHMLRRMQP